MSGFHVVFGLTSRNFHKQDLSPYFVRGLETGSGWQTLKNTSMVTSTVKFRCHKKWRCVLRWVKRLWSTAEHATDRACNYDVIWNFGKMQTAPAWSAQGASETTRLLQFRWQRNDKSNASGVAHIPVLRNRGIGVGLHEHYIMLYASRREGRIWVLGLQFGHRQILTPFALYRMPARCRKTHSRTNC